MLSPRPPLGAKLIISPTYPQQRGAGKQSKLGAWAWVVSIFLLVNRHQERRRGGWERRGGRKERWTENEIRERQKERSCI